VGDLSYADNYPFYYQVRWDTWSRLIESSAAYQPWIWTSGNHEIEFLPEVVCHDSTNLENRLICYWIVNCLRKTQKKCEASAEVVRTGVCRVRQRFSSHSKLAFQLHTRHQTAHHHSGTPSSVDLLTSLSLHLIPHMVSRNQSSISSQMMKFCQCILILVDDIYIILWELLCGTGIYSPQWTWLQTELSTVDRNVTPWLIVLLHCPWYNSNAASYMAGESMRVVFEQMVVTSQVDVVFAGHVHAYERTVSPLFSIPCGLCIFVHMLCWSSSSSL